MVTDVDAEAGADLVFELARHYFDIGAGDVDACVEASFVVSVSDCAAIAYVCTDRAVVRALLPGVAIVWPTKRLFSKLG